MYKEIRVQALTMNHIQSRNQDSQYKRQNDSDYAESRLAASEDFDTRHVQDFYIENVLPIVKINGNRLIGPNYTINKMVLGLTQS